jgi:hypothetical protein
MDLDCAIELLKECGCTVEPHEYRENWVTVVDTDGNFLHLTGIEDEAPRVLGKAYGLIDNDPTMMTDTLDMTGEGEEDYEEIMGFLEEDEDEATS